MIAVDSSVVVAAFATWHEFHRSAAAALDRRPRLPAHAAIESYSVLTRLPPPHRAQPALVRDYLQVNFASPYLVLSEARVATFVADMVEAGVVGGATYDALIATVARDAAATLLTCDLRAKRTYDLLGVAVEFIG